MLDWKVVGLTIAGIILIDFCSIRFVFVPLYKRFREAKRVFFNGTIVKGVVIGNNTRLDADQEKQYAPVVRFFTTDKVRYVVESDDFRTAMPEIGTEVPVGYNANDPASAIIHPGVVFCLRLFLLLVVAAVLPAVSWMFLHKCGVLEWLAAHFLPNS